MYLKAKSVDEGWKEFTLDHWREEFWGQPVQSDRGSCGVFVCLVKYFLASVKNSNLHVGLWTASILARSPLLLSVTFTSTLTVIIIRQNCYCHCDWYYH